jgi:thiamine biosynthesis lipoprotein
VSARHLAHAGLSAVLIAALACESTRTAEKSLARFEFERAQMGTLFRVVLYAPAKSVAEAACAAAFECLDGLNARMSDYDPASELSKLSSASEAAAPTPWIPISEDLAVVLARAAEIAAASDGAFDVTCGNATRLWRRAIREGELPPPEELEEARASIDWRAVELSAERRSARLLRRGMRLDLGGIAKGFALDRMLGVLAERGVSSALVDGGGDVAVSAAPPGERGWRIELGPVTPAQTGPRAVLVLEHAAVATSGDLVHSAVIAGLRYSHIVDPHTAMGLTTNCGASVVARDGMTADALATAATVLGPQACDRLWARFEDCDFRVVAMTERGLAIRESPRFSKHSSP